MCEKVSKVVLCDRHGTFARFSEDDFHFFVPGPQHFGHLHGQVAWQAQLRVFCLEGAACGEDPLRVERHFLWQAQYLGHFCSCCFSPWHGCARSDTTFLFRAILRGRRSIW